MATPSLPLMTLSIPSVPSVETPTAPDDDDDIEDQGEGISFEDSLDEIPELALPTSRGVDPNDYLNVEDKWSTEHLKCVRGHTKVNAKKRDNVNLKALLGANTFIVGPFPPLLKRVPAVYG
ncbi:hypothetical protein K438DRAFT_1966449 [Mycena galopus ATCC 62051]|nr:hypothetical protein K438DRAFT_1966449 [Mycena galopus ATCC 62051]